MIHRPTRKIVWQPVFFWVAFLSFAVSNAMANDGAVKNAPSSQSLLEKYKSYNQVIVFDSIVANVQESGLSYVTRKTMYQLINADAAKELATIVLDYDPLSADITIKDAYIIRQEGQRDELFSAGKVHDYPAPARMIYWGARQKMIEPGFLNVGDRVYIEYVRKGFTYALLRSDDDERFIPPMRGHYYDIIEFFDTRPIHHKYFKVNLPSSKELIYKTYNADFKVNVLESDRIKTAEFELSEVLPVKKEFRRVADVDVAPKVIVTTTKRWEDKATWFYGVNEDYGSFKSTPEIDSKVNEILNGATNELDSIARLNRWCADEIRYSGISMGPGEGYTLHSGEMNFTDRCGVCKDKAGMLVTMLRAAGFKSYAAMTMAGSRIENIPADQFNHSVTVVKLRSGEYKLLDPTWVPFVRELWSSREQQQNYLLGLPQGDILRETPVSSPDNHYLKINNKAILDTEGTLQGTITVTAEGQSDAMVRAIFTRSFRSHWDSNLRNQILQIYPTAIIKEARYTDPYKYYEAPVLITVSYSIPYFASTQGKTLIFKTMTSNGVFGYAQFYQGWVNEPKERNFDFTGNCSQQVEISEEITLPGKPKLQDIEKYIGSSKGKYATINTEVKVVGNIITANTTERFEQRVYPAAAWSEFLTLVDLRNRFRQPFIIKL